jgi:hypothetical protein
VWSNDVTSSFQSRGVEQGRLQVKPSNGIVSERSFSFVWNSTMTTWKVKFSYFNKKGNQEFECEVPVATILQDLKGGQYRMIPLNDDLGNMEIRFSTNSFLPPSAVSFCDPQQIASENLFFRPVESTDRVQEGSIIDNNIKFPKTLSISVDLTGSNGDLRTGLHNENPDRNDYRKAIIVFSDLVSYLSPDKSMPIWGFGYEKLSRSGSKRKFNVPDNEYCTNFTEVYWTSNGPVGCGASVQCYDTMLEQLKNGEFRLAGGTEYDKVLNSVEPTLKRGEHSILLFFTDGRADDEASFDLHCRRLSTDRSKFLSIILVVVGDRKQDIVDKFKNKRYPNLLVFGQDDLNSGKIYSSAMNWLDQRSSQLSTV